MGFILKDAPEIRNVFPIDFTRQTFPFESMYEDYGFLVKFNPDRSYNETLIVANKATNILHESKCMSERLDFYGFGKVVLKTMSVEDEFDVVRLEKMQYVLLHAILRSRSDCIDRMVHSNVFNKTEAAYEGFSEECFSQIVTELDVEGVTFYRVNMEIQPDNDKCIKIEENYLEHVGYSGPIGALAVNFLVNKCKQNDTFKKMREMEFLFSYGKVSEQQRNKLITDYQNLGEESKKLLGECYAEMSDEI